MLTSLLKKSLRIFLNNRGYQIDKLPSLERDIKNGKYIWLQKLGIRTVLDVGANIGQFTRMISDILGDVNIYAFEPLADCYGELVKNTHHIKNINYFNFALGEKHSETSIYHNEFSPSSSILRMKKLHKNAFPQTTNSKKEIIQVEDLDSIAERIYWAQKILMKIDVQGFEINVLTGAVLSLKKIDIVIVETSFVYLYEKQPLFDEIYKFLVEQNFSYHGNFDQMKDPNSGRILQADAIFIRN